MQRIRKAGKRDSIEREIIEELRWRGAIVVQLDAPVDLLVGHLGVWYPVEVKSGAAAPMRASQELFFAQCDGAHLPYYVLSHLDDVLTFIKITGPHSQQIG